MALEHILAAIEQEAAREITRIEADSQREAAAILAQAHTQVGEIEATEAAARDGDLLAAAARLRNQARVAATRHLMRTREAIFQHALSAARLQLAAIPTLPNYDRMLAALVSEALSALPRGAASPPEDTHAVEVRCDPRDAGLVRALLARATLPGPTSTLNPILNTWGGVEVASADGRIVVRNTLEARLERAETHLRRLIAEAIPAAAAATGEVMLEGDSG